MNRKEQSPDIKASNRDAIYQARRRAIRFGSIAAGAVIAVPTANWAYDQVADGLDTLTAPRCGAEMTDPATIYIVSGDLIGDNATARFDRDSLVVDGAEYPVLTIPSALQLEVGSQTVDIRIHPIVTTEGGLEHVIIECD